MMGAFFDRFAWNTDQWSLMSISVSSASVLALVNETVRFVSLQTDLRGHVRDPWSKWYFTHTELF